MEITSVPKVFILILNWNGWQDTLGCLESVQRLSYANSRIVVLDNGSTDGSVDKVKTWADSRLQVKSKLLSYEPMTESACWFEYNRVTAEAGGLPELEAKIESLSSARRIVLIQTGANLGFAGGNNVGIKYALDRGADYIWLLNNDTEVHPEALGQMVKIAEMDPVIGMVGSQIFHLGQRDKLLFAGGKINWLGGWCIHDTRHGLEEKPRDADFITGCSLLVRRDVVERVGMLDESFFLYFEDTDWSIRAKKAGFKLVVAFSSIVWHKETGSVGRRSPTHEYYVTRNNLLFMKKHAEPLLWVTFAPFFLFKITIKALLFSARGQFNLLSPIVQAVEDFFVGRFGEQMVK